MSKPLIKISEVTNEFSVYKVVFILYNAFKASV